ncbi:uncharacterized protein EDB93DRAFT_1152548 [Suillus bovinus]|uniref:uncharacterized protein n=1 Tax=Suillus bovinus TaxID=48563 RepID=UPI001B8828A0|nr:uncharacterized protein EDB93DRAFT_1152548 [Suillus bovinus]KAG2144658.1 hypothetical protein EDB93DRAFT_1152548 [Suillus bovinus]
MVSSSYDIGLTSPVSRATVLFLLGPIISSSAQDARVGYSRYTNVIKDKIPWLIGNLYLYIPFVAMCYTACSLLPSLSNLPALYSIVGAAEI